MAACPEPLVANQCEYHPYLNQDAVRAACARHGLAFTSYCPLGKGDLVNEPVVRAIAAAHGKASPDAARMAVTRALVRLAEEMDVEG